MLALSATPRCQPSVCRWLPRALAVTKIGTFRGMAGDGVSTSPKWPFMPKWLAGNMLITEYRSLRQIVVPEVVAEPTRFPWESLPSDLEQRLRWLKGADSAQSRSSKLESSIHHARTIFVHATLRIPTATSHPSPPSQCSSKKRPSGH